MFINILLNIEFLTKKLIGKVFSDRKTKHLFYSLNNHITTSGFEEERKIKFVSSSKESYTHTFTSRNFQEIDNVILDSKLGKVFCNWNEFVSASSSWPLKEISKDSYNGSSLLKRFKSIKIDESLQYVSLPSNTYYHWLIEDLPRFIRLREIYGNNFRTVIYKRSTKYVTDYCKVANLEFVTAPRLTYLKKIVIAQKNQETGTPNPYDIEILRKTFLDTQDEIPKAKIFVSRLYSSRTPPWESELILRLQKRGWKILQCEELDLVTQISLFRTAQMICGLHGAGLANMIWANSNCVVLELNESFRSNCFKLLAQILGLQNHQVNTLGLTAREIEKMIVDFS